MPARAAALLAAAASLGAACGGRPHAGLFDLPPLLEFANGSAVRSAEAWSARQGEMRDLLEEWFYGAAPKAPALVESRTVNSTKERGYIDLWVEVVFDTPDPQPNASFQMEVVYPVACIQRPCPLFTTQSDHRRWAVVGLERGYVVAITPNADTDDATDAFRLAYPDATWGLIRRRAWLGSRALDWLLQQSFVDPRHVALTGHSRNGKLAMIQAAWDSRVTAVISSSSGAPAMSPYRFMSSWTFSEDPFGPWPNPPPMLNCSCTVPGSSFWPDDRPPDPRCCWWLPSVRDLCGVENSVPIDSHALIGLVAPRHFQSQSAWTDPCDVSFADEQALRAAAPVYQWLGFPDRLSIFWRPGQHHGFEDPNAYFDWFDFAFGRNPDTITRSLFFPQRFLHNFSFAAWDHQYCPQGAPRGVGGCAPAPPPPGSKDPIVARLQYALGEGPATGPMWSPGGGYGLVSHSYIFQMLKRGAGDSDVDGGVRYQAVNFGSYNYAHLFWQDGREGDTLPVLVWLHPYSYQGGWTEDYPRDSRRTFEALALGGYLVMAFDQVGFATRILQGSQAFYRRYPHWSLLGKMVNDVFAALDMMAAGRDGPFPGGDPVDGHYGGHWYPKPNASSVALVGFSLGGTVAMHAGAVWAADPSSHGRTNLTIRAVACIACVHPLRNDTLEETAGGNRRLYDIHAVLPRLGWFRDSGGRFPLEAWPYDYDDLIAAIADSGAGVMVYAPRRDRLANWPAVQATLTRAQGRTPAALLNITTVDEPPLMNDLTQAYILDWLSHLM